ncbi:MAG: AMP-binding protein [Planctomycetota bacterium]
MSIHWPILRRLITHPLKTAAVDDRRSYRGIDLVVASMHVADAIEAEAKTKHVGLMLPTSGAFPISALGAWSAGKTIVPLNYLLKPAELQYVIDDSEIDTIVTVGPMLDFIGHTPSNVKILKLEDLNFKSIPSPRIPAFTSGDELAALIYTSGTSGRPKGVMLSHRAIKTNALQGAKGLNLTQGDSFFGVLPQFHSYGMTQLTITPLISGVKVIYTARFQPKKLLTLVREHQATIFVGIPSMFNALAGIRSAGPDDVASLRLVVSGSEGLPSAVYDKFHAKFGKPISEGYGMTEMAPGTHCCLTGDTERATVGPPLPGIEQRIVDPKTEEVLGFNQDGEVRLRGPNMMDGYWKLPEITAKAFDADGFYKTGDQGRIRPDGFLSITGRIKEMIIVAGENVFPREIEEVIDRHPAVKACGVTGMPDDTRGEVPIAFVELEDDAADTDTREILTFCREHIAGYKVPKEIRAVEALPRNPTGKVLRRGLLELLPADATA